VKPMSGIPGVRAERDRAWQKTQRRIGSREAVQPRRLPSFLAEIQPKEGIFASHHSRPPFLKSLGLHQQSTKETGPRKEKKEKKRRKKKKIEPEPSYAKK